MQASEDGHDVSYRWLAPNGMRPPSFVRCCAPIGVELAAASDRDQVEQQPLEIALAALHDGEIVGQLGADTEAVEALLDFEVKRR